MLHHSLHPFHLTVILAAASSSILVVATETRTSMPEGASATFVCDSASWIKEDLNKVDAVVSLGTQLAADAPGGADKYRLAAEGKKLTVLHLAATDSGVFKCKNYKYSLTVARDPTCAPTDGAFEEGVERTMTCGGVAVAGSASPRVEWRIADEIVHSASPDDYSEPDTAAGAAAATASVEYKLVPKFVDNGKPLSCVLEYDNWNASFPKPRCGIPKMDIKFQPRIECPEIQYLNENSTKHVAFCEILGNPRPNEGSIFWKTDNNDRVYLDRKDR